MAHETDLRGSVLERARQFHLKVREVRNIAVRLIGYIDGTPEQLTGRVLFAYQQSLQKQRDDIVNWPHGSLTDANVRAEIARQFPVGFLASAPARGYADAAAVQTETAAVNGSFTDLQTEADNLVTSQLDPLTFGQAMDLQLTSPQTDALRAQAVIVRDLINGDIIA